MHSTLFLNVCKEMRITKVRIHKNVIDVGYILNMYYTTINKYISREFKVTDYFGNISEYTIPIKKASVVEIMVHPDYAEEDIMVNSEISSDTVKGEVLNNEIECIGKLFSIKNYTFLNYK